MEATGIKVLEIGGNLAATLIIIFVILMVMIHLETRKKGK